MILNDSQNRRMSFLKGLKEDPKVREEIIALEKKEHYQNEVAIDELVEANESIESELIELKKELIDNKRIKEQVKKNELLLSINSMNSFEEQLMMAHYFTKDCEVRPLLQYIETTKNQLWSVNGYATVRIDSDIPEAFQDCLLKLDGDEFTINPPTGVSMKQNVDAVMARTFESDEYQSTTFDLRRLILDEKQEVDHYGKAWIPVGTALSQLGVPNAIDSINR